MIRMLGLLNLYYIWQLTSISLNFLCSFVSFSSDLTSTSLTCSSSEWILLQQKKNNVKNPYLIKVFYYCIHLWTHPVLFSPYRDMRLIRPVLNSPFLEFYNIYLLCIVLNSPSDQRAKIKQGRNFPCIQ